MWASLTSYCFPPSLKKNIYIYIEGELDEVEEEEDMLTEMEVEQASPVVPIPAPVEPPVKRKRGRPPKSKPDGKCLIGDRFWCHLTRSVGFFTYNKVPFKQMYQFEKMCL